MSWCDKLASTPSVGLKFDYHFVPIDLLAHAFAPILDRLVEADKARFTIDKYEVNSLEFTTEEGFKYGADPNRLWVTFQHRFKAKTVSGGPPVMEMLSKPAPFTEMLPMVRTKAIEATFLYPNSGDRKLQRVGVTTNTNVAEDEAPPGIRRLISYMSRPWKGALDAYTMRIVGEVEKTSGWTDRCIHTVTKPDETEREGKETLLTVNLDWQRTFVQSRSAKQDTLPSLLEACSSAALAYFETVGEGSQFDEEILSSRESA